jgi:predicted  nucleic acid-binding Zn-ribbon protein
MKKFREISEAIKDKYDIGEYDQEGDMAKSDLRSIIANSKRVHDMLKDDDNLPEWVQSKITKAEDYMSTVANYLESEMNEAVKKLPKTNPC